MKLDTEPRLTGLPPILIDWARAVVRAFNPVSDSVDSQAAQIAALQAAMATAGVTGEFKFFALGSAPTGWVAGNGGTIGSAASGATRANADTQTLFNAWWAAYSDAQLPILTSAGGASTRGASAAADWAANKRLTVFDVRERFIRNAGAASINGTKYAATEVPANGGNAGAIVVPWTGNGIEFPDSTDGVNSSYNTITPTGAGTSVIQTATVRPLNIAFLGCFKL